MNNTDFDYVADLLRRHSGMELRPEQSYLLDSRLSFLVREEGFGSVDELLRHACTQKEAVLHERIVDAMTINETFFFRDKIPFDHLREVVLPDLAAKGKKLVRLWCAACSSGQEPYSIAMMLAQDPHLVGNAQVEIVATDISENIMTRARTGCFSQFEVQRGLPIRLLMQYFEEKDGQWRANDALRSNIRFVRHNLLDSPIHLGCFDVIFCRNVLTYFTKDIKREVLARIGGQLPVDGHLYLGAAESATGLSTIFRETEMGRGVYQRVEAESESESQIRAA